MTGATERDPFERIEFAKAQVERLARDVGPDRMAEPAMIPSLVELIASSLGCALIVERSAARRIGALFPAEAPKED